MTYKKMIVGRLPVRMADSASGEGRSLDHASGMNDAAPLQSEAKPTPYTTH